MGEYAGSIRTGVRDVIHGRAARRIQSSRRTDALRDLMIGTGCIAANTQPADDLSVLVERDAASEEDQPTRDLVCATALATSRREELRIKRVGLTETRQ